MGAGRGCDPGPGLRLCDDGRARSAVAELRAAVFLAAGHADRGPSPRAGFLLLGAAAVAARHALRPDDACRRPGRDRAGLPGAMAAGANPHAGGRPAGGSARQICGGFCQSAAGRAAVGMDSVSRHARPNPRQRHARPHQGARSPPERRLADARAWRLPAGLSRAFRSQSRCFVVREGARATAP